MNKREQTEVEVLKAFKEEIPSIYFSDKSEADYTDWCDSAYTLFHDSLHFPPKMFENCSLIDFGAGTGENTIQYANWGALCTLVEMNENASKVSVDVFKKYSSNFNKHKFINTSIFDFESEEKFDIVVSRGVLHHTGDKKGGFEKIASFVKPGGYIIVGFSNQSGAFQNSLQRMAVFKYGKNWDEMVDVSEKLFKEDIDRSQKFSNRTRRSIIFDRYVVPKQDDPSVSQVLDWFKKSDIKFYSSNPQFVLPIMGDSYLNKPRFDIRDYPDLGVFSEAIWMTQTIGDPEEAPLILESLKQFSNNQFALTDYMNDIVPDSNIDIDLLIDKIEKFQFSETKVNLTGHLIRKHEKFFAEVKEFLDLMKNGSSLDSIADYLKTTEILFKGRNGLRMVDFIGFKV
jgi:2-polyprenyl-3-methyl-5-hydroxy-6-metoxy-1,4-benzoquinol methylase